MSVSSAVCLISTRADFDIEWLRWARQLQDTLDLHFWDQDRGGYFSTSDKDPAILLRMKEDYDGAEPTPQFTRGSQPVAPGPAFSTMIFFSITPAMLFAIASLPA